MLTRDQQYAQDVYDRVMAIKEANFAKIYGSMAHKLPILIHVSGLAQALAFVQARGSGKGPEQLLEDLSQTVLREPVEELLKRSRGNAQTSDLHEYMRLTEQTLAALLWYKRYAQSILDVESDDTERSE
jgi:CRISPR-associated protein Cmr5